MKIWKPIGLVMIIIAGSFSFWVWWTVSQAQIYQSKYGPEIRSEFGFTHGSPYVSAGRKEIEVLTIHPAKGGYMDKVGFRDGDIVTSESTPEEKRYPCKWPKGETVYQLIREKQGH